MFSTYLTVYHLCSGAGLLVTATQRQVLADFPGQWASVAGNSDPVVSASTLQH